MNYISTGIFEFLPNFLRFGARKYCSFLGEMSVSITVKISLVCLNGAGQSASQRAICEPCKFRIQV